MKNGGEKRTVSVTVRMSEEDEARFQQVAQRLWPNAVMSRSAVILSLARMCADTHLKRKDRPSRP